MSAGLTPQLVEELRGSSALIDRATAEACRGIIARRGTEWSAWEIGRALDDLWKLSRDEDCTYDRPSIGVSYALWYQAKRTHDALRILAPRIAGYTGSLRIVDLGCGTGATACAVALVVGALERCGSSAVTKIVVDGIDSSPFMVEVAREIFAELVRDTGCLRVRATFESTPWDSVEPEDGVPTEIVGGYLLDHSDGPHAAEIAQRLKALSDKLSAKSVLLSTAQHKQSQLEQVRTEFEREEWKSSDGDFELAAEFAGDSLGACHALRCDWYERHELAERSPPHWSDKRAPAPLAMHRERGPISSALFRDERDARLEDAVQREAAKPERRLTVIVGAAGSGKTIVLSERIARTITDTRTADPATRILVTAFNKDVVDLIAKETVRSLESGGLTVRHKRLGDGPRSCAAKGCGHHRLDIVVGGRPVHVKLMNRDKLPTRIFGISHLGSDWNDDAPRLELGRRIGDLDAVDKALVAKLGHEFLADEFERVIFGLSCVSVADYQEIGRKGRVTPLAKGRIREVIWRLLMQPHAIPSHVNQRMLACRRYEAAVTAARPALPKDRWTHVFVDECQDFTAPEIQLLARVPQDPRNLCIAVDASQSVHLGRSYRRPRIAGAQPRTHRLDGSYRLPLRVCEALQPLAEDIHSSHAKSRPQDELDTVLLRSRKAAVPGPRPIVLAGGVYAADQLASVLRAYFPAAEGKRLLAADCGGRTLSVTGRAAHDCAWTVKPGNMKRDKGLEWPCVVVTNECRSWCDTSEAASERLFTAMTRTTALLVIVLWADGDPTTTSLLGRLKGDRLLCWDEAAETAFQSAQRATPVAS